MYMMATSGHRIFNSVQLSVTRPLNRLKPCSKSWLKKVLLRLLLSQEVRQLSPFMQKEKILNAVPVLLFIGIRVTMIYVLNNILLLRHWSFHALFLYPVKQNYAWISGINLSLQKTNCKSVFIF